MGISQFNRSNPMIILMRRVNDEFTTASITATKRVIRRVIVQCAWQLAIFGVMLRQFFVYHKELGVYGIWKTIICFTFIILAMVIGFNVVIYCGKNRKMREINDMIYGENYSVADVNNEDVLKVITDLEFMLGRLDGATTMSIFWHGMILASQLLMLDFLLRL